MYSRMAITVFLPKTSLTHETERQTDAGGATITSYIMLHRTDTFVALRASNQKHCPTAVNLYASTLKRVDKLGLSV